MRLRIALLVAALAALLAGCAGGTTTSPTTAPTTAPTTSVATDEASGLPFVELADLPDEARQTIDLIDAGGPFPYAKDGSTFNNFEGLLPDQRRGFYREYTVPTPGESDRGARRIVAGGDALYYTDDHYQSFRRIRR